MAIYSAGEQQLGAAFRHCWERHDLIPKAASEPGPAGWWPTCWPSTAAVSPHSITRTGHIPAMGLGFSACPQSRCRRAGNYLGSIHQPPGVEQAEAMLVAVAEARLVCVPLGVMVLVLQRHTGCSAYLVDTSSLKPPVLKGRRPRHIPQWWGSKPTWPY